MSGPLARILLRYGVGFLVGAGIISSDVAVLIAEDPDIAALVNWLLSGVSVATVEGWYWLAKKYGWAT